jgi:GT2 family glycosyltransferase
MSSGVAVVVPNFNGEAVLGACLDAIEAQTLAADEVLVVDNGSTDGSLELLRARGVRVLELGRNHGFAGGSNRGVAATGAPWVAVLNSDARPAPDWLERLRAVPQRDDVWQLGGVLVSPSTGLVESAGDHWSERGYAYKLGSGLRPDQLPDAPYEVFAAPGAAPLFRRDRFEALGGYEERFFLYYEDVDLAFRALLRGWRAIVEPAARIEHDLGGSGTRPLVRFHVARNQVWTAVRCTPRLAPRFLAASWLCELRHNRPMASELRGRAAALRGLRWALRTRREIQASRILTAEEVRARLTLPEGLRG